MFFLLSFIFFSSTKSENKRAGQVLPRGRGRGKEEVAQIMSTYVRNAKMIKE
jgi:hypothetical protein